MRLPDPPGGERVFAATESEAPHAPEDVRAEDVRAEDVRAEDVRAEDVRAEDVRAEDVRAEDDRAEDVRAEDVRAEDDRAEDDRAEDDRAEDDRAEDDRAEDDRARSGIAAPPTASRGTKIATGVLFAACAGVVLWLLIFIAVDGDAVPLVAALTGAVLTVVIPPLVSAIHRRVNEPSSGRVR
uniref:hypothetical protein n=1 Tax=Streptomyces sp. F11 TaxID=319318 RepID=UPI0018690D3D|nr:hypothetical protein [Streptomyces sp. F11]